MPAAIKCAWQQEPRLITARLSNVRRLSLWRLTTRRLKGAALVAHKPRRGNFLFLSPRFFASIPAMSSPIHPENVPVFILCGGLGTRLKEETEFRPKPMVPIGEHPILWHVMRVYARHGFRRFVLCLGFKADVVKDYFSNFHLHNNDCTIALKSNRMVVHES